MFSKNCRFPGFERVKSIFATFWTPGKSFLIPLEKSTSGPPCKYFLRHPWVYTWTLRDILHNLDKLFVAEKAQVT